MKKGKLLFLPIFFFGLAIFFLIHSIPQVIVASKGPLPLEKVDFSDDIEGLYVTGTISYIYDCYCEESENEAITRREYIIDADNLRYMALRTDGQNIAAANTLLNASYDYYMGNDTDSILAAAQYNVTGVIEKIPSETLGFYYDYLVENSISEESRKLFLPYYIRVTDYESEAFSDMLVPLLFFIAGAISSIIVLIRFFQQSVSKQKE